MGAVTVLLAAVCYFYLDRPVAEWVHGLPSATRAPAKVLTEFGDAAYSLVFFGVLAAVYWMTGRRETAKRMAYVFACVAVAGILVNLVKPLFGRYRPKPWLEEGLWGFHPFAPFEYEFASCPSGHAAVAMALAISLINLFPRGWPLWLLFGATVALTRVFTLSHFVGDVILGAYVGTAIAVLLRARMSRAPG